MSATQQDILDWLPFARMLAHKWRPFEMEQEDAEQEAALAVVKAAANPEFDPEQANFGTWANWAVCHHMQNLWRKAARLKRDGSTVPLYLTNEGGGEWERPEMAVEPQTSKTDIGLRTKVERAIDELSPRQRGVIRARYGLDGEPQTPKEIAESIHRSHTCVHNAEKAGMRKLRVALAGLAACLCLVSGCATKPLPTPAKTLVTTPQSFQPVLRLYGLAGYPYRVEGSTNGTEWTTVAVLTMPTNMTADVELLLPYSPMWQFRTVTP